ncbi:hypothetical protein M422DRAFT_48990 [Sphaerobolus stellatus SS14]|uniref:Cyanovirin-N domain-containing protein n=1 Tax=Sphaerobolus stellatus (strain SS14) TaxID=990650 RepID=A0A0C9UCD1_SPHS4|nr:hypothetical protein M422DRAFT_48990 [Sphaerobolus stellatus SS14]
MYTLNTLSLILVLLCHQSALATADLVPRASSLIDGCTVLNDPSTPSDTLIASCLAPDGSTKVSSLDLNNCLGNNNGNLVCGNHFSSTCGNLFFEAGTSIVQGVCKAKNQSIVNTMIDISNCVGNNAGIVVCKN